MKNLRLRVMLLVPLITAMTLGGIGLGLFVHARVEADLVAAGDDELTRALLSAFDRSPGTPQGRPGPAGDRRDGPPLADDGAFRPELPAGENGPQEVVLDASGTVIFQSEDGAMLAARDLSAYAGKEGTFSVGGDPRFRIATVLRPDGATNVIGLSLAEVDASLESLRRSLWIGLAGLIALQVLVAGLVVRSVTRPVARLAQASHRIAAGDLETSIEMSSGPREAVDLGADVNAMVSRLRSIISEREAAAKEADQARADMQRFMADASHEFRTPLTALKGFTDLYQSGMLDDAGLENAMTRIGVESERLTALANDLLHVLRPTDSQTIETVDMEAIASAVVQDLRAAFPRKDVRYVPSRSGSCMVSGDPSRLHQAVLNLGANACQHSPEGETVFVSVSQVGSVVVLAVVDHGPGIDPSMAESMFAPFVRADRSRARSKHDGAGLGLTIAQSIAEHHDARIELSETPGGGLTAAFEIPSLEMT